MRLTSVGVSLRLTSVVVSLLFVCWLCALTPGAAADVLPPPSTILIAGMVGNQHAYGCGVIVGAAASTVTILTAAHNLGFAEVRYLTAAGEALNVTASRSIDQHDLAILTATRPKGKFSVATFGSPPLIGTHVHLWGPIRDVPFTPHDGSIRDVDARVKDLPPDAFAIDCAACAHGDSGAGVYDDAGRLIGVVTSAYFAGTQKLFVLVEGYRPADVLAHAASE